MSHDETNDKTTSNDDDWWPQLAESSLSSKRWLRHYQQQISICSNSNNNNSVCVSNLWEACVLVSSGAYTDSHNKQQVVYKSLTSAT